MQTLCCSFPLSRCRAPQKLPNKEFELFESARGGRVFKLPATSRSAGHPAIGGTSDRGPFLSPLRCWFVSALKNLAASCQSSSSLLVNETNQRLTRMATKKMNNSGAFSPGR
ncbi:hypothetical protein ACFLZ5_03765 [Thermodesulfobacteriota bacterium]